MNQRKAKADGYGSEAVGNTLVGRTHDDQEEEHGHDDFADEAGASE